MAFTDVSQCLTIHIWRGDGALPRQPKVVTLTSLMPRIYRELFLRGIQGIHFASGLEHVARPGNLHHGAVIGKSPVAEGDLGAGALEQRAGDENAKTEAATPALGLVCAA